MVPWSRNSRRGEAAAGMLAGRCGKSRVTSLSSETIKEMLHGIKAEKPVLRLAHLTFARLQCGNDHMMFTNEHKASNLRLSVTCKRNVDDGMSRQGIKTQQLRLHQHWSALVSDYMMNAVLIARQPCPRLKGPLHRP